MRDWGWLYDLCNNISRRFEAVEASSDRFKKKIGVVEARVEALEGELKAVLLLVHEMKGRFDVLMLVRRQEARPDVEAGGGDEAKRKI